MIIDDSSSSELRRYAAFLGASGVALGAAGAHGLHKQLSQRGKVENWRTAVLYQLFHAAALVGVSALAYHNKDESAQYSRIGRLIAAGTVMFSGSIYCLCFEIGPKKALGPITPLGGLFMIGGWTLLGITSSR